MRRTAIAVLVLAAVVVFSRLAHVDLVWIEEAYGMAAGAEILRGKVLYRDIWFDKPPLYAWFYTVFGVQPGAVLRMAGAAVVLVSTALTYLLCRRLWGTREAWTGAALLALGLTFYVPSATMAVAPDLLMVPAHLAAIALAAAGRPVWSGISAGVALLINGKGILVLAACALWTGRQSGFLVLGWLATVGASVWLLPLQEYWRQVWVWGVQYSRDTFVANPAIEGLRRTANWAGFHATAVLGAVVIFRCARDWRLLLWAAIALAGVVAGFRFFPRYYFLLLPPLAVAAARGVWLLNAHARLAVLALTLVPIVRFGPAVMVPEKSRDTALMEDSRVAGEWVRRNARMGDTLFVWGYRPDVYVYSGLPAATRFLDSQPLTGVLADRHLTDSRPTLSAAGGVNRAELHHSAPAFIVDGLGPLNPRLAITEYADLRIWLGRYVVATSGRTFVIYSRTR